MVQEQLYLLLLVQDAVMRECVCFCDCVYVCVLVSMCAQRMLWRALSSGIALGIHCPWQRTLSSDFVRAYARNVSFTRTSFSVRFHNRLRTGFICEYNYVRSYIHPTIISEGGFIHIRYSEKYLLSFIIVYY